MTSYDDNQLDKRSETIPDKPINKREDIYVKSCLTEQECREERVKHYLAISTLPLYMTLLMTTLVASWATGNDAYLKCFESTLKFFTPLVGAVYGYYFYRRFRNKESKKRKQKS